MSNIKLIGRNVGNATRKTLEATLEAHRAWVKTKSDESKASIVRDFKVGYIAGLLNVAMAESERILSNGKGAACESKAHIKAIDASVSAVRYHITHRDGTSTTTTPTTSKRLSTTLVPVRDKIIDQLGGLTRDEVNAVLAAVRDGIKWE